MRQPSVTITNVHTDDANPDAAKYRISNKAGHTQAVATIKADTGVGELRPGAGVRPGQGLVPSNGSWLVGDALPGGDLTPGMIPFISCVLTTKGNTPIASKPVGNLGAICGVHRCGGEGVMPLHVEVRERRFKLFTETVDYAEVAGPDGDVPINVFVLVEPLGWI